MIILFRLVRKRIVSSLLAIIVTKFRRLYLLQLHFIVIFFLFFSRNYSYSDYETNAFKLRYTC